MAVSMPVYNASCFLDKTAAFQQCTLLACKAKITAAFWVVNPYLPCLQDNSHCAPILQHLSWLQCCLRVMATLAPLRLMLLSCLQITSDCAPTCAGHAACLTALPLLAGCGELCPQPAAHVSHPHASGAGRCVALSGAAVPWRRVP